VSHEPPGRRPQPVGTHLTPVGHLRYFVALLPDPEAARALGQLARGMAAEAGGRPLAAGDIHMTLAFIGARETVFGERLASAIAPLAAGPAYPSLPLTRLGRFGRAGRPALLWAGPDTTPGWLAELAGELRRALRAMPCEFDERPLVPHLTLVREARPGAAFGPALAPAVRVAAWRLAVGRNRPPGERLRYAWS